MHPQLKGPPQAQISTKKLLQATPIYKDEKLQAYIEKLGEEIISVSEMAGEKFIFTLLDSPDLNAFATRDNYIYVNRGLLNYVSNEASWSQYWPMKWAISPADHVTGQEGQATGAQDSIHYCRRALRQQ